MAIYTVWVEVEVECTDEPGDWYVELSEPEYIKFASYRDPEKAKFAARRCVNRVHAMKQGPRNAARARRRSPGDA